MQKVRIQRRCKQIVTLGIVMAVSALLSAFQPASAQVLVYETGSASTRSFVQGDIEIEVYVREDGAAVCAFLRNIATLEPSDRSNYCARGSDVEVSDTLDSAWGRGTVEWSTYEEGKGRGAKAGGTYTPGTTTIDVTWSGFGDTETTVDYYDGCWIGLFGDCWLEGRPNPYSYQRRSATFSGTITDSEFGTFVFDGETGYLTQPIL